MHQQPKRWDSAERLQLGFSLDDPLFLSILSFNIPKQFQINSVVIRHFTAVMIGILEYRTSFLWQKQMFA